MHDNDNDNDNTTEGEQTTSRASGYMWRLIPEGLLRELNELGAAHFYIAKDGTVAQYTPLEGGQS